MYAGSQAVVVLPAVTPFQDGPYKTVSTTAPIVVQSAEIYLASSSVQSEWQFAALGAGLVGFAGGIDILPDNSIQLITSGFPTIGTWTRDGWINVSLTLDYATQKFALALNGVTVANNEPFCGNNSGPCSGANVPGYVNGLFDVFGGTPSVNDEGFMDNYSVSTPSVPEPATWVMALLGFGGLGVLGRRKARGGRAALAA